MPRVAISKEERLRRHNERARLKRASLTPEQLEAQRELERARYWQTRFKYGV